MRSTQDQLQNQRHSLAHLLAASVQELYPDAKRTIGPAIDNGFYYDFDFTNPITEDDLSKIESKMRELLPTFTNFDRNEVSLGKAKKEFADNPYKLELIDEFGADGQNLTIYQSGKFRDLCRGGHADDLSQIDPESFKLWKLAGAYWRGDEKNKMLTRIYGLAFDSKKEVDDYLALQEDLKKRDHRILGPQLGLFMFHEYAPGIPFYLPKGTIVRNELEKFVREISYGQGYNEVRLPQMFEAELFKTSGHWEHFRDDMFVLQSEERTFGLKPMNCPGHMLVFKHGLYSYRDLPLRLAEMTTLYRNELSGTLSGLTRVRAFGQDDTHIFLAPEQISDEVADLLKRIEKIYSTFGMKVENVMLATKPEKALGSHEDWKQAENALAEALNKASWKFEMNPGDGAFYGPKIDMQVQDVLGRKWQLATVQLDFQQPQRFGLEYVASDGSRKTPVVIHRALLGSFERFLAILIEHYAGAFPTWLAPVQVTVLPISENQNKYAQTVVDQLRQNNIRVELHDKSESIGKKIREAQTQKIPHMLIVGGKEQESNTVASRDRTGKDYGQTKLEDFITTIKKEIEERSRA